MRKILGCTLIVSALGFQSLQATPYSSSNEVQVCTADQALSSNVCLDGVGAGVYGFDNTRVAVTNFSTGARSAAGDDESVTSFGKSNLNGLAAGEYFNGLSWWGSFNTTSMEGNIGITGARAGNYIGDTKSFMFGADKFVTDRLIVGLAGGYEDTEVFTLYNGGNNDSDGFTVVPYAAFLINNHFSFDAAFGYSSLEYDTDRVSTTAGGPTLTGSYDADRIFFSANLNGTTNYNKWIFGGRLGILYTEEEQDAYTETGVGARTVSERTIDLTQAIAGFEVAYAGSIFEPYAGLTYANDLSRDTGGSGTLPGLPGGNAPAFSDKDELQLAAGLRFYRDQITASLDYLDIKGRSNFDSHSFMLNVRIDM